MSSDWKGYLAGIRRLLADKRLFTSEDGWLRFKDESARSTYAKLLENIGNAVDVLANRGRLAVALSIANILADIEWPPALEEKRRPLIDALNGFHTLLVDPGNFAAGLPGYSKEELQLASSIMVSSARDLLETPCRYDQLATVGRVASVGVALSVYCQSEWRKEAQARMTNDEIQKRHVAFLLAWARVNVAAQELNHLAGTVLFRLDTAVPTSGD